MTVSNQYSLCPGIIEWPQNYPLHILVCYHSTTMLALYTHLHQFLVHTYQLWLYNYSGIPRYVVDNFGVTLWYQDMVNTEMKLSCTIIINHSMETVTRTHILLTVLWCSEGSLHSHSDISTNSRHSVVVHSRGVQLLPQHHCHSVPCCASLSGLCRVWQVHVGWVSTILDSTVIRAGEPR